MGNTWSEFWNAADEVVKEEKNVSFRTVGTPPNMNVELPRISLHHLIQHNENKEEIQQTGLIYQHLKERGFVVISFESDDNQLPTDLQHFEEKLHNFYQSGSEFFDQPLEIKSKFSDPKNENKGYVQIENLREYLKLRKTDHKQNTETSENASTTSSDQSIAWPENLPKFSESFHQVFDGLFDVSWNVFLNLYNDINNKQTEKDVNLLKDVNQCVQEKASISIIHYFPSTSELRDEVCEFDNKLMRTDRVKKVFPRPIEPRKSQRVVCSSHQDTGILTFIVCSEVPGLQIFDKLNKVWIDVERLLTPKKDLVVMLGQKAPVFTGSNELEPTIHRVLLEHEIHRTSMAFLFDIAK